MNINPVDFRGFSLGAPSIPNLPTVGALGLQAVQLKMNEQEALRADALNRARLQQADQAMLLQNIQDTNRLNQQNYQFNQTLGLEKKKQGLLEKEALADRAFKQQQFGLEARKTDLAGQEILSREKIAGANNLQDMMKMQVEQLAAKKKEDLASLGAFAVQAKLGMEQAKTPTEAALLRNSIVDESIQNGYVDKNMGAQLKKMSLSGFNNYLNHAMVLTDAASKYKAMRPKSEGESSITLPDGTIIKTSNATTANITKSQEEMVDAQASLEQIQPYLDPPETFFGLLSGKQAITKVRELAKVIPGIRSDQADVDEMALYGEFNANAKLNIMKTAKTLAGARFSDADLKMVDQIMPQVGPLETKAEYAAKAKLVKNFLEQSLRTRQEILSTGKYKVGTKEYDDAFSKMLPEVLSKAKEMSTPKTYRFNPATGRLE